MDIQDLKNRFSIASEINIIEGKNGIPFIEIRNAHSHALISLYGGQLLSYSSNNEELLFLSEIANYAEGKAIKGGVPVCWPWFGVDPENKGRQSHGFARNKMWQLRSTEVLSASECKVVMGLNNDDETFKLWPYSFDLEIEIIVGNSLSVVLRTTNTDKESFEITQALHTYFLISDITKIYLKGLDSKNYLDKAKINVGDVRKLQSGNVKFVEEVDRIYLDVPGVMQLIDEQGDRIINISSLGNKTAVVWNPAAELTQKMSDLNNNDYKNFVCVETANAANDVVVVAPGESYELSVNYKLADL